MRLTFAILLGLLSLQASAKVSEFTLSNGLKVLVQEDHRAPVAVTMVWYHVGSSDEPGGITGVSHAIEHMMFKGTEKNPAGVFSKTIAAVGGQENAMTHYDYTAYYETIAASQLPVSFELEADRMHNLQLSDLEFNREIKVIQEERRMRTDDNPQALTFERYLAAAHLTEPYHHPVIGWMEDLHNMRTQDVKAWYENFYAPNNATLVVVGDVDPEKVFNLAKLYFENIPKRPEFIRKKQVEPANLGPKSVEIRAPAQLPMLMFGFTVPSAVTAEKESDAYVLEVITGILSGGESSRFAKNLVRGSQIASSADVYYNMYSRYQTQFMFFATPANSRNLNDVNERMWREIKNLQTELVSEAELKRIKTQIVAQKVFERDSLMGQAMEIGLLETLGLGWKASLQYPEKIKEVTPEQIRDVARRYFKPENVTTARLFPLANTKENS